MEDLTPPDNSSPPSVVLASRGWPSVRLPGPLSCSKTLPEGKRSLTRPLKMEFDPPSDEGGSPGYRKSGSALPSAE